MELTAEDYEWLLDTVDAFHRAETVGDLSRELLARGERLGVRGWVEADAEARWIEGAPDHRRMAAWNGTLRLPEAGAEGEIVWRSEADVALALGWVAPLGRWVGCWMEPVSTDGEPLALRLMPALLTSYIRASVNRRTEGRGVDGPVGGLTLREEEVSRWISEGKTDMDRPDSRHQRTNRRQTP